MKKIVVVFLAKTNGKKEIEITIEYLPQKSLEDLFAQASVKFETKYPGVPYEIVSFRVEK
jgi:hypothetical protein